MARAAPISTALVADRPVVGVLLMIGFCILAPLGDAMAKILVVSFTVFQIVAVRYAIQAIVLTPFVARKGLGMSPRAWRLTAIRTVLHFSAISMMFLSLKYLPLADAIAIAYVLPFIMLLLGRFVLNETVGMRRLLACAVGFAGTLLVVQPSFATVGWPALLPLGVAVGFALFMVVTRQIAKEVEPLTLQAASGLVAAAACGTAYLLLPLPWTPPDAMAWAILLGIGLLGTSAHLMMTWAMRLAPASTVAPVQYLEIPFATLIGWAIFSEWPNGLAAIGIAVTLAAGLYILHRERMAEREAVR